MDQFKKEHYQFAYGNTLDSSNDQEDNQSIHTGVESDQESNHSVHTNVENNDDQVSMHSNADIPDNNSSHTGTTNPDMPDLEDEAVDQGNPNLEWDDEAAEPAQAWGGDVQNPDIQLNMPNLNITIRHSTPMNQNPFIRRPRLPNSPIIRNIAGWLDNVSPLHGAGPEMRDNIGLAQPLPPFVTKRGRVTKPVHRYDAEMESQLQKDTRDALNISKPLKRLKSPAVPKPVPVDVPVEANVPVNDPFARRSRMARSPSGPALPPRPTLVESEKPKKTAPTVTAKTVHKASNH
jgi:hypothetical protein